MMTLLKSNKDKIRQAKIITRPIRLSDISFVLNLNEANVEVLSPMDDAKFLFFMNHSERFTVTEVNGVPAAFLLALREGEDAYSSENYIWFSKEYEKFLYIDRIVIAEEYRGMHLGKQIYEGVFEHAKNTGVDIVTAEVDIIPYNGPSLKFHRAMGFEEVGQQVIRGGEIKVSLQRRKV